MLFFSLKIDTKEREKGVGRDLKLESLSLGHENDGGEEGKV